MLKVVIFFAFLAIFVAGTEYRAPTQWWNTDDNKEYKDGKHRVPFPQCLVSGAKSNYLDSPSLIKLFDKAIDDELKNLKHEHHENKKHHYDDEMDYDNYGTKGDHHKSRSAATAAIKLTRDIMTVLACDLNGTDTDNLEHFLQKFKMPEEFCKYRDAPDCSEKKTYRTATGVCNNLERPYEGSSQTAFGRILSADYDDHLSEPRRKSVKGGLLPSCRRVSLALGSKPLFNREYNNFWVIYGQFMGHDMALSTPVTDTYSTPISSCTCDSKHDWNKCNVIDIKSDDPYLRGQKCMAFPATAQAFKNQICSLGVKEQMNGNTHFLDLSNIYGNTLRAAAVLRSDDGTLKSTRRHWAKLEFPPGQREGKSCVDATYKQPCFAGGDSRLMINLLFSGIQAIHLRAHNIAVKELHELNPYWKNNELYEVARQINIAWFQRVTWNEWLPILFGEENYATYFGGKGASEYKKGESEHKKGDSEYKKGESEHKKGDSEYKKGESDYKKGETEYKKHVAPVTYNEVATAAFRLHTLVRDLFSRCTPDGKRIDQLWLHDINAKAKFAYDVEANGLDSIICGAFYDYGFSHDGNFAHQIHHRLFETTNQYKQLWRNDLVAINICRGREHGIRSYNAYRHHCKLPKASYFEDFGDTINYDGIELLQKLYKDTDDVDLFVALALEDQIPGGVIGPVSACLIAEQFNVIRDGDRLFYSHHGVLTPEQLKEMQDYPIHCFYCAFVDIDEIPLNPFKSPNDSDNMLQRCSECRPFKFNYWKDKSS
ncbi:unnamed protein product [Adineta steineri]|uniref:Peroxidase n=1 Tax=Adineta steineri TaxID=433720 RepID=A0A813ZYR0_9BILA|nr:unnamed protein product [Adineta steineri]